MKIISKNIFFIAYFLMFIVHFIIWKSLDLTNDVVFFKYYLFLTFLYLMVITILSLIKKIEPNYVGFGFLGLMMFKLTIMFLIMKKLNLSEIPYYKYHFIPPYLASLVLETLYAIKLIKTEKNQ